MRPGLPVAEPAETVGAAAAPEVRPAEAAEVSLTPVAEPVSWAVAVFGTELDWDEEPVSS